MDEGETTYAVVRMGTDESLPGEVLMFFRRKGICEVFFVSDVLFGAEATRARQCGCHRGDASHSNSPCAECERRKRVEWESTECQTEEPDNYTPASVALELQGTESQSTSSLCVVEAEPIEFDVKPFQHSDQKVVICARPSGMAAHRTVNDAHLIPLIQIDSDDEGEDVEECVQQQQEGEGVETTYHSDLSSPFSECKHRIARISESTDGDDADEVEEMKEEEEDESMSTSDDEHTAVEDSSSESECEYDSRRRHRVASSKPTPGRRRLKCALCHRAVPCNGYFAAAAHALTHYTGILFQCRLCPAGTQLKSDLLMHARAMHSSESPEDTVEDKRDKKSEEDLDNLVQQCFGEYGIDKNTKFEDEEVAPKKTKKYDPVVIEKETWSETECGQLAHKVVLLIRKVINRKMESIPCQAPGCGAMLSRKALRGHAIAHFIGPRYQCNLCPSSSNYSEAMKKHCVKQHNSVHAFTNLRTPQLDAYLDAVFLRCFVLDADEKGDENEDNYMEEDGKMFCKWPDCTVLVRANVSSFESHAIGHLRPRWFRCRICNAIASRRYDVYSHIRMKHEGESVEEAVEDLRPDDWREELAGTSRECFGEEMEKKRAAVRMLKTPATESRGRAGVRGRMRGFEVTPQHTTTQRLVLSKDSPSKSTNCAVCSMQVRRFLPAMRTHISTHLSLPPMYKCSLCDESSHFESCLKQHVSTSHCGEAEVVDGSSEEGREEVRQMLLRAFPSDVEEKEGSAACPAPLTRTAADGKEERLFVCALCLTRAYPSRTAREHALGHFDQPLFKCSSDHCQYTNTRLAKAKQHAQTHHADGDATMIDLRTAEMMSQVEAHYRRCFPSIPASRRGEKGDETPAPAKEKIFITEEDEDSVKIELHQRLSILPGTTKIECAKCDVTVQRIMGSIRSHAVRRHFNGVPSHKCKHCEYRCWEACVMRDHLKNRHEHAADDDFDGELSEQDKLRINKVMMVCFPQAVAAGAVHEATPSGKNRKRKFENIWKLSNLAALERERGGTPKRHRLMRGETRNPHACTQCGVPCTAPSEQKSHAIKHFDFVAYKCPLCDSTSKYMQSIVCHLENAHSEDATGGRDKVKAMVVDLWTDERRSELTDLVSSLFPPADERIRQWEAEDEKEREAMALDDTLEAPDEEEWKEGEGEKQPGPRGAHDCLECGVRCGSLMKKESHAVIHLCWTQQAFGCFLCQFTSNYHNNVRNHANKKHGRLIGMGYVDLRTDKMKAELEAALEKYFPKPEDEKEEEEEGQKEGKVEV